ncbi:MAG: flagellar biosynthetic protein FliO [Alphaproteobacteria bacterium]|nr:flagellar biosynthetic protein FliO [Alphaproteobacteria bacterium]
MTGPADISWVNALVSFALILALLAGLAAFLKYVSSRGITLPLRSSMKQRRLKLIESLPLDARRRVVIVRCDNDEHLLLLGGQNDIVVKTNLSKSEKEPSSL